MNLSLYGAAAALDGNIKWQQIISENLSASSTPGFKKKGIAFSTVQAGVMGVPTDPFTTKPSVLPSPSYSTDFSEGALSRTGAKTDISIEGPGFLAIRMPNGQLAYTRDGGFRVNLQGQMLNKAGLPFEGEGGPIQLDSRSVENISISPAGDIEQGGQPRGKLRLVEFNEQDLPRLQEIGGGYFLPTDPNIQPAAAQNSNVMQSFLEASNALPATEMSSLLLALRHFEANQKVIQMQDERMGKVIQELSATT